MNVRTSALRRTLFAKARLADDSRYVCALERAQGPNATPANATQRRDISLFERARARLLRARARWRMFLSAPARWSMF